MFKLFKKKKKTRPCKTPDEIELMLRSFETRHRNLNNGYHRIIPEKDALKIIKLEAKIHILKNVLKLK